MTTITEALAEIKTVNKRIKSKQDFILQYMIRPDHLKDPLEKSGGAVEAIASEFQSMRDLEQRVVDVRQGISEANDKTEIMLEGINRSIAQWLIWRREVAPTRKYFLERVVSSLKNARDVAKRQNTSSFRSPQEIEKPMDVIVNFDEKATVKELEQIENILGQLDGQLSLKNATVQI